MGLALSDLYSTRQVEGYSENLGVGGSLTEVYKCDWENRITYSNLLRNALVSDTVNYPSWRCGDPVGVKPVGWDEGESVPAQVLLSATYSSPDSAENDSAGHGAATAPRTSDWAKWHERWEGGGEALTVGTGYRWLTPPSDSIKKSGASAVKIVPQTTLMLTGQTGLTTTGKAKIIALIGKVNSDAITIKGHSYAQRYLLFLGADLDEVDGSDAGGKPYYNVTLKFMANHDHDWNEFWRDDPAWTKTAQPMWDHIVSVDDVTETVYSDGAFSTLNPSGW